MVGSLFSDDISQYFIDRELWLPSDKFYQNLDHSVQDVKKYNEQCNSRNSIKKKTGLRRYCALLLNYLANPYKKSEEEILAYDDCILLNYWIYGKIFDQHSNISKSGEAFGELQSLWYEHIEDQSRTSYKNKCEPDNLIATQDDWWKRKELYGYCVDYDTLQQIITNYDTLKDMNPYYDKYCKQIYKYLKEKDKLYKEYKENCFTSEPKNCPDFFTKCANKDPTILLNKLSCSEEMQRNEALSSKKEGPATTETDPGLTAVASSLPTDSQISHEGTNPVTNTGNVLLGVVVTSMTSGALYKFTPLGKMLRNGLGFNRNNINVHDNGLFDYAPGSFNPYSMGGDEHYIGYQPA